MFRIGQRLGAGSMGEVFAGVHVPSGGAVAIKRVRPELATDPRFVAAFEAEAHALAALDHPGVVRVFHVGPIGGRPALVTERAAGTLAQVGRLPWRSLRPVLAHLLDVLGWVHAREVVHGDLSPANVLWGCRAGSAPLPTPLSGVRLADFGLVRSMREVGAVRGGTPGFAPPEQLRGQAPTVAGDLYALARVARSLLAERPDGAVGRWLDWLERADPRSRPRAAADALVELPVDVALASAPVPPAAEDETRPVFDLLGVEEDAPSGGSGVAGTIAPDGWRRRPIPDPRPPPLAVSPELLAVRRPDPRGRDGELARIWGWLAEPDARVVVVSGSGCGARALRHTVAHRVAEVGGVGVVDPPLASTDPAEVLRTLEAWGGGRPVVVAVEGAPEWVAWLARAPELTPRVVALVAEAPPGPGVRRLDLGPLAEDAVLQVLVGGFGLEPAWAARLSASCGGRVGHAVRHVRRLARAGRLEGTRDGFRAIDAAPDPGLPPLLPVDRDALERLALGEGIPAERLVAPAQLDRLRARGWVGRAGALDLNLQASLVAEARRSGRAADHHRAIARAVGGADPVVEAAHRLAAGGAADALAGIRGWLDRLHHHAAGELRRAARLVSAHRERWEAMNLADRARLHRLASWAAGDASDETVQAIELARRAGEPGLLAHALVDLGVRCIQRKDLAGAADALSELDARGAIGDDHELAGRIATLRMLVALYRRDGALPELARALAHGGWVSSSQGHTALAEWHLGRGEVARAREAAEQAVAIASGRFALEALITLAVTQRAAGEPAQASATLDRLEASARARADIAALARAGLLRAHLLRGQGRHEEAVEMLLRCRERSELLGVDNPVITLVLGLVLGGALERLDELARQTPDGFGLPLDAQTPLLRAPFALHRFMVAAGLGRLDEARAWLDRVEALLAEGAALDGDGRWLVARLSTFAGDERCRERLVRLSRG